MGGAHDLQLYRRGRRHESAGEVLTGQTKQIVDHWRSGIIASIPNLARHSRSPEGAPIPEYLTKSNLRFEQWILDTCLRPYDQDWINYQQEIALRHTSAKKNQVDEGANVFITGRRKSELDAAVKEIGRGVTGVQGDASKLADIDALYEVIKQQIVLNASIVATKGNQAFSVYSATKAAVRSFARTWCVDLKDRKIRVNAISPGVVPTPGYNTSLGMTHEQVDQFVRSWKKRG